jgi:hypothetical protein
MNDGITMFLVETEMPLYLSDYAAEAAGINIPVKGSNKL